MLKDLNEWYIDMDMTPSAQQLEFRRKGFDTLANGINKEDVCNLVSIYFGVPVSDSFKERFSSSFSAIDPAFSARNTNELTLLAGAMLVYLAENTSEYSSLSELLAIISASYHSPASSTRILSSLRARFDMDSLLLRKTEDDAEEENESDIIDTLETVMEKNEEFNSDVQDALLNALRTLRQETEDKNCEIQRKLSVYREDSQILWWMTSQWSNTYGKPMKLLEKKSVCLSIGVEAAGFVSNYPGPYSMKSVIYHVLESCTGAGSAITLPTLLKATDCDWKETQRGKFAAQSLQKLLPLHAAISCSHNTTSEEQWYPKYVADYLCGNKPQAATPKEYAWMIYLEELAMKCYQSL